MHAKSISAVVAVWALTGTNLVLGTGPEHGLLRAGGMSDGHGVFHAVATATAKAGATDEAVSFLDLTSTVPADWVKQPPSSSMRLVQYEVPGRGGEKADFVVYFFGKTQGGSADANIARWRSQFTTGPDGGPVEPSVSRFKVEDMPVTLVELRGSYARNVGVGPGETARSDQTLLAAIVEAPAGNLFVQLHGPSDTVQAEKAQFLQFLRGIHAAPKP